MSVASIRSALAIEFLYEEQILFLDDPLFQCRSDGASTQCLFAAFGFILLPNSQTDLNYGRISNILYLLEIAWPDSDSRSDFLNLPQYS
jgi:hypothetical protein